VTTRVAWTRRALRNLYHIREFIRKEHPAAAERVGRRIENAASGLARFPESGHAGKVPGTRELVIPGLPYFLIYQVNSDAVTILRVFHDKQKWPPTR
jgi:toxin ParE1/3/4